MIDSIWFSYIYTEDIYDLPEENPTFNLKKEEKEKSTLHFQGNNQRKILFLLHESPLPSHQAQFHRILQYLKLTDEDIHWLESSELNHFEQIDYSKYEKILMLMDDMEIKRLGIKGLNYNKIEIIGKTQQLISHSLRKMLEDASVKVPLMNKLKQLFGI